MKESATRRAGITSAGNWIVDRVKRVDCLPGRGMLANIIDQQFSPGGAPANVLNDLARLRAPFPLAGIGVVGNDPDGAYLVETFKALGVDVSGLQVTEDAPTSYTDVMTDIKTGDRLFYHHRGANACFAPRHVAAESLTCRIFHLGYLLLLDSLDRVDPVCGTVAAALLKRVREQGITTSVDVVSEESDRFTTFVPPALRHVDYLIINEIEAARATGMPTREAGGKIDGPGLIKAVDRLYGFGDMKLVAVHMPEGVYMRDAGGQRWSLGSLQLPEGFIAGSVGAGDAFCAGMLYGLHEDWDTVEAARFAMHCAAASLSAPGASEGITGLEDVMQLGRRFEERPAPVRI